MTDRIVELRWLGRAVLKSRPLNTFTIAIVTPSIPVLAKR